MSNAHWEALTERGGEVAKSSRKLCLPCGILSVSGLLWQKRPLQQ